MPKSAPSLSLPEIKSDLRAQVRHLRAPGRGKDAVFVIASDEHKIPAELPRHVLVRRKSHGTLLTTNAEKARAFARGPVDDELLAHVLGYVQTKREVAASGDPVIVSAVDDRGHIVAEALVSKRLAEQQAAIFKRQVPHARIVVGMAPAHAAERLTAAIRQGPVHGRKGRRHAGKARRG